MYLELLEERTLLSCYQAVHPLFDLAAVTTSPFPTDRFTVADNTQNTGRRVKLPTDSTTGLSDFQDTQVLNTLDGFNLQPRLSIPFDGPINVSTVNSGPIDVSTVNSKAVFLVRMGDTLDCHDHDVQVVGINQIVWDPATNTLHVESDDLLDQHTRYALIVTNALHDAGGHPVQATSAFRLAPLTLLCSRDPALRSYGLELAEGLVAAYRVGVRPQDIVGASVFTTMSATATLEKIRDQIDAAPAPTGDPMLHEPNGTPMVFNLSDVTKITLNQQTTTSGNFTSSDVDFLQMLRVIPGAVGQVAFGSYLSRNYEKPGGYIPAVGTRNTPAIQGYNEIYFTLYLPSGPEPEGGWPVAIFGHGANSSKDGIYGLPAVAATMAAEGIATIGINTVGFGFGPSSTITVNASEPGGGTDSETFLAGGRSIDQNGDGTIANSEGFLAASPQAIISERDGRIQTDADLMQLVRVIEAGIDVDGEGGVDLNASHISYLGISLGGMIGASFLAVEPDVSVGALGVLGGATIERLRLGSNRGGAGVIPGLTAANILSSRTPSLINGPGSPINGPGITQLDGMNVSAPYFDENMPLRDGVPLNVSYADGTTGVIQSPVTNDVPGAMAIQKLLDNYEWVSQGGDPVAYAPHLRKDPLPGVPAKSVIVQFAKGDPLPVNPTTTAFLRAGDLADRATYYRYDLAFPGQNPNARPSPAYPHTFEALITSNNSIIQAVALGAQRQIATFLATDGEVIDNLADITLNGRQLFEVPIQGPLPEGLNFTIPASATASAEVQISGSQAPGPIPTAAATFESTSAALTVPQAARAIPVPLAGPSAMPTSPLIDLALEALPPLAPLEYDLAAGLLRPARRRR
jgi:hypothetical protein